jgi:nucleoside-diphosphate-sugar epimerase
VNATLNGFDIGDIDEAVAHAAAALDELAGASLFITGGTGFFGQWLLVVLARANAIRSLGITATVLTRDAAGFRARCPELGAQPFLRLEEGDVRSFAFPGGRFTHLIHAAADTGAEADRDRAQLVDTILAGTRHTLDFAVSAAIRRILIVSSGAIYGSQPADLANLPEDFPGAEPVRESPSTYGQAKHLAEQRAIRQGEDSGIPVVIARAFAFVGPGLSLDGHFAIGNFIRDALAGNAITVKSDGSPLRSYLYAGDLAAWLLRLLVSGRAGRAYNVGSDQAVSIAELAGLVAGILSTALGVRIEAKPAQGEARSRYIPSIQRARAELGLDAWTRLDEAIRRTARWAGAQQGRASGGK